MSGWVLVLTKQLSSDDPFHLYHPQIWQIMRDYIMVCPTIPSSVFAGPVTAGFTGAMNATFLATPSNDVQVAQFWEGVNIMNANTFAGATPASTVPVQAAMLANTNAVAGTIAPLTNTPGNFSNPDEYAKALGAFGMWRNSSTAATQIASDPAAFPAGYYCPVGQGADFIKKYRDLSPENPAATNVGEYFLISLHGSVLTSLPVAQLTLSTWPCSRSLL